MGRGFVRALLAVTVFTVAWLVASPAVAAERAPLFSRVVLTSTAPSTPMSPLSSRSESRSDADDADAPIDPAAPAPLCDARGASRVAPRAQMQDVEVSLEADDVECAWSARGGLSRGAPRGPSPAPVDPSPSLDPAHVTASLAIACAVASRAPAPVAGAANDLVGFGSNVDRPPRA